MLVEVEGFISVREEISETQFIGPNSESTKVVPVDRMKLQILASTTKSTCLLACLLPANL